MKNNDKAETSKGIKVTTFRLAQIFSHGVNKAYQKTHSTDLRKEIVNKLLE